MAAEMNAATVFGRGPLRWTAAIAVLGMLSGCGGFLPSGGPGTAEILEPNPEQTIAFTVADLDAAAVRATSDGVISGFNLDFRGVGPERDTLGIGDVLSISIWEDTDSGLYTTPGSKVAQLDNVTVDDNGRINVPYVGNIRASGRTIASIRDTIRQSLADRTSPDVAVARTSRNSRAVSVQGVVGNPGVYQLGINQDRLLPILAAAGGSDLDPHLVQVTVRRGDQQTVAWLEDVYSQAADNIALRGGDVVILETRERFFNAFGAVRRPGRQSFTRRDMTVLDAVASAGGLDGLNATPSGIFLFRRERPEIVERLTVNGERKAHGLDQSLEELPGPQPVVYQLRLENSEAMILAGAFTIREGDTIYVTEAPYVAWRKVLSVVIPTLATAGGVAALGQAFEDVD